MFDIEIQIQLQNRTDLGVRDYEPGTEIIDHEGVSANRDTPDITPLCRSGNNTITAFVKDTGGTKIGFPYPVYVKWKR